MFAVAVCGAVHLAAQAVITGDADVVVAGGQENMSASPHVLSGSRNGFRLGNAKLVDSMVHDGLSDIFNNCHMGITAENVAREYGISRAEQDDFACASQKQSRSGAKGR